MKILLVLIIFTAFMFFLYKKIPKDEINYTILGDKELFSYNIISKNFSDLIYDKLKDESSFGFYSKDFIQYDIRIIDLINDIKENKKIDNISIQNILKRTNLLILNIGNNELNYKLSNKDSSDLNDKMIFKYLDEVIDDLLDLIVLIRKYNDGNIYLIGYYNDTLNSDNDKYYEYINNKLSIYSKSNNINYINLYNILNKNNDYLTHTKQVYITNEGNLAIFSKLYSKINRLYLHKNN